MATERKSPDGIITQNNLSGILSAIQDDPDTPDANWWTAPNNNADSLGIVSFPTPTGNPTIGVDLQEFKVWIRKSPGQTGTPTVTIEVRDNGSTRLLFGARNVTSDSGQLESYTWNANVLVSADGSGVEIYIYGTKSGGAPTARAVVEVGAVEWNVTYSGVITNYQSLPATAIGIVSLARASTFYRTLTSTAIGTALLSTAKMFTTALSVVATGIVSLSISKTFVKILASTALGIPVLTKATTFYRTLAAVATASPVLSKKLYQTLIATATGIVSLTTAKMFTKTLAVIATGISSLTYVKTFKKALTGVVTGIANLATQFISGGGGQTFYQAISATAITITSFLLTMSRILKIHSDVTISQDLNFVSKIASLYNISSTLSRDLTLKSTITEK